LDFYNFLFFLFLLYTSRTISQTKAHLFSKQP
jgi:hypothetical protein